MDNLQTSKIAASQNVDKKLKKNSIFFEKSVDRLHFLAYNLSCCCGTQVKNLRKQQQDKTFRGVAQLG